MAEAAAVEVPREILVRLLERAERTCRAGLGTEDAPGVRGRGLSDLGEAVVDAHRALAGADARERLRTPLDPAPPTDGVRAARAKMAGDDAAEQKGAE